MKKYIIILLFFLVTGLVSAEQTNWVGIQLTDTPDCLTSHLNLVKNKSLMIENIAAGSPAEKAGLERYDVIIRVNGDAFSGIEDFKKKISGHFADGMLPLTFYRKGKTKNLKLKLDANPGEDPVWLFPDEKLNITKKQLLSPGTVMLKDGSSMLLDEFIHSDEFGNLGKAAQDMIKKMTEEAQKESAGTLRAIIPPNIWDSLPRKMTSVSQRISAVNDDFELEVRDGRIISLKSSVTGETLLENVPLASIQNGKVSLDEKAEKFITETCRLGKDNTYSDYTVSAENFMKREKEAAKTAKEMLENGEYDFRALKKCFSFSSVDGNFTLSVTSGTIQELKRNDPEEVIISNVPLSDIEEGKVKLPEDALLFIIKTEIKERSRLPLNKTMKK